MSALVLTSVLLLAAADSDESKAKALYKEGETAYNLGQFDAALAKYSDAYKLKALPGFLFNIAQCHRQLQQFERAAFFYGRFIDTSPPKAPNVDLAKSLQEEMKQRETERVAKETADKMDEQKKADEEARAKEKARDELKQAQLTPVEPIVAPVVPPPLPPPTVESAPVYQQGWFWGVVVGAVVVVGAGVGTIAYVAQPKPRMPSLGDIKR